MELTIHAQNTRAAKKRSLFLKYEETSTDRVDKSVEIEEPNQAILNKLTWLVVFLFAILGASLLFGEKYNSTNDKQSKHKSALIEKSYDKPFDLNVLQVQKQRTTAQPDTDASLRERNKVFIQYAQAIASKVRYHWQLPPGFSTTGLRAQIGVMLSYEGRLVMPLRTIKSSGDNVFDASVLEAIRKSMPLPLPPKEEWRDAFIRDEIIMNFP